MTWVRIDDQQPRHPKMWRLSDGAYRLAMHALCHAASFSTDGFLDAAYITTLTPAATKAAKYADELVTAGVWETVIGGWCIHDYLEYQPSAAQVAAERERTKERVRAYREHRNAGRTNGVTP